MVALDGLAHRVRLLVLRGVAAVLGLVPGEHAVGAVDLGLALGRGAAVRGLARLRRRVLGVGVEGLVRGLVDRAAKRLAYAVDALEAGLDVVANVGHFCGVWGCFLYVEMCRL